MTPDDPASLAGWLVTLAEAFETGDPPRPAFSRWLRESARLLLELADLRLDLRPAPVVARPTSCAWCGRRLPAPGRGRPRRFCSKAHGYRFHDAHRDRPGKVGGKRAGAIVYHRRGRSTAATRRGPA